MRSIDERIVDMQFNNKQFEDGIQTSLKSLDNLKKGLEDSSKGNGLAGLQSGVQTIADRFSTLGIIGVTALQNITNQAIATGTQLVKSLTLDPVMAGLQEYETKMNAITTILTNTKSKGTTLDDVNIALGQLNEYADKTIYNFAEMTRNVGTFTAAGIDLETSVGAIKGIANLAAGSGSDAQQASRAMYQLSQALAEGRMSLQSWNSVVNAGMGGELFQHALIDKAVEMGELMPEIANQIKTGEIAFREAIRATGTSAPLLNVTKDMMVGVFNDFANDESLVKAATEVKTFTQLLDTMKESVQSGWAVSWENIIGDKEEATKLFTAISNGFGSIMGASADARNEMLLFWNENGGRDAVIQSLSNVFDGLLQILKPIKNAFEEVFPPMTGEKLVEISEDLLKLTENFKIGDETADKLHRTFEGLFALLDIGRQAFGFLIGKAGDLAGVLLPGAGGLLDFTANIGTFIVGLNDAIRTGDVFNKAFDTVKDGITTIAASVKNDLKGMLEPQAFQAMQNFISEAAEKMKDGFNKIKEVFNGFGGMDLSGVESLEKEAATHFKPFTALGETMSLAFESIRGVLEKTAPAFSKLASIVRKAFGSLSNVISDTFEIGGFQNVLDLINGGLFAAILIGIQKFMDSLTEITNGAGGFLGSITDILDGVKGSLEAYQSSLKANVLMTIATAIGILAASLVVLSMIDSEKLGVALVAITTLFVELAGTMTVLNEAIGSGQMAKVAGQMVLMSAALLILSAAMKSLAELDWEGLARGSIGIGVLAATLVIAAESLSKSAPSMIKGGTGLIAFSTAIVILAQAVKQLGELDVEALTNGLVGVGILMAEIAGFSQIVKPDKLMSIGVAMIAMGAAMLIFEEAVASMGSLSLEEIAKSLITMAGSLGIIVTALNLMPMDTGAKSAGLLALSAAILVLSQAMQSLGGMSWEEIAKSLIALAGSLTIITIAMTAMTGGLAGAAAMLVMSAALLALAPAIMMFGSMELTEIGTALLALVGVFVVLGEAGVILAPLTPVILGLSAAIALLGVGVLAIGGGLLAFSAGLAALAVSGTAGAAAFVVIVTSLLSLVPLVIEKLGEGVIAFARVIAEGMPVIMEAVKAIFEGLIILLGELTPPFLDTVFKFIDELLTKLVEYVPKFVDSGMKILVGFLQGISDHIGDVVKAAIDVVVNFLKGVAEKIHDVVAVGVDIISAIIKAIGTETPKLVAAGFQMIIDFINGLADTIREKTPLLIDAIMNLAGAIIEGLVNGLLSGIGKVGEAIKNVGNSLINSFKNLLGIHSPSTVFMGFAGNIITGLANGITSGISTVIGKAKEIGSAVIDTVRNKFLEIKDIAGNIINGLTNGLKNGLSSVTSAAKNVAQSALDSAKKTLGIHSPSKAFAEIGEYSGEGIIVGLKSMIGAVGKSAKGIGKTAVDSLSQAISGINDILNSDMDSYPIIRPVMDFSDIQAGISKIDQMLLNNKSISVDLSKVAAVSSAVNVSPTHKDRWNDSQTHPTQPTQIINQFDMTGMTVRSKQDIDDIATKLYQKQQQAMRGKGMRRT